MTGTPEGSTERGFMEKPGFEPAIPGLQGIALIHYTTGASLIYVWSSKWVKKPIMFSNIFMKIHIRSFTYHTII